MKAKVIGPEILFYGLTIDVEKRVEVRYFNTDDCEYFRPDQIKIVEE